MITLCLDCGQRSPWPLGNCERCGSMLLERRLSHAMLPFDGLDHLGFVECAACGTSPPAQAGRQWFGAGGAAGVPDCSTTQAHNVDCGHSRNGL